MIRINGAKVAELRKALGLTQEGLAERAELDQTHISNIESGKHTNPTIQTAGRLAVALGIEMMELLTDPDTARQAT